jgi:putative serine protease PepD
MEPTVGPPPRRGRWKIPLAVVAAVALLVGAFAAGWELRTHDDSGSSANATPTAATFDTGADDRPTEPPISSDGEEPVAAVAEAVAPAVVQLEVANGLGSGVIYDPDGLILTAAHVVTGNDTVTVRLADGSTRDGTVVGFDTDSDIGVVSIEDPPDNLPVAVLADSAPQVGDLAVAVGSPYGLDQTVTSGIVSALDRPSPAGGPSVGTLQIDTPINPGNSGGPVANREGEVIGIASFIQSQTGGSVGLGFAIPVDIAERVADAIVADEPVEFGYLGIEGGDAAGDQAGALVASVVPGSPADDGGLQDGDLVVEADGEPVNSFGDLGVIIRRHDPGDELDLVVNRDGERQDFTITLGSTADQ